MSIKATAAKNAAKGKRVPKARTMATLKAVADSKASTFVTASNGKYTVGKCSALGSGCTLEHLQNNRHHCADCGDGVHAIEPCGKEAKGKMYCYPCYQDNKDKENELHLNTGNCWFWFGLVNLLRCGWAFCPSHFAPTIKVGTT